MNSGKIDRPAGEWRQMEGAPKGRPVLVWDDYYLMRIARFDELRGLWVTDLPYGTERGEVEMELEPKRWMELPAPPVGRVSGN